jgi:hypothetical protein
MVAISGEVQLLFSDIVPAMPQCGTIDDLFQPHAA